MSRSIWEGRSTAKNDEMKLVGRNIVGNIDPNMLSRMNFEVRQVHREHEDNEHGVEARGGAQAPSDVGTRRISSEGSPSGVRIINVQHHHHFYRYYSCSFRKRLNKFLRRNREET